MIYELGFRIGYTTWLAQSPVFIVGVLISEKVTLLFPSSNTCSTGRVEGSAQGGILPNAGVPWRLDAWLLVTDQVPVDIGFFST